MYFRLLLLKIVNLVTQSLHGVMKNKCIMPRFYNILKGIHFWKVLFEHFILIWICLCILRKSELKGLDLSTMGIVYLLSFNQLWIMRRYILEGCIFALSQFFTYLDSSSIPDEFMITSTNSSNDCSLHCDPFSICPLVCAIALYSRNRKYHKEIRFIHSKEWVHCRVHYHWTILCITHACFNSNPILIPSGRSGWNAFPSILSLSKLFPRQQMGM